MKKHTTMIMKLNHLSFPSSDLPATAAFFEKYLGFTIARKLATAYEMKRPGVDVVIEQADYSEEWPRNFQVGFELPTEAEVHELYQRFKADSVQMETEVFKHDRGSRFFCREPGGIRFEINTRADATEQYRGTVNK